MEIFAPTKFGDGVAVLDTSSSLPPIFLLGSTTPSLAARGRSSEKVNVTPPLGLIDRGAAASYAPQRRPVLGFCLGLALADSTKATPRRDAHADTSSSLVCVWTVGYFPLLDVETPPRGRSREAGRGRQNKESYSGLPPVRLDGHIRSSKTPTWLCDEAASGDQ